MKIIITMLAGAIISLILNFILATIRIAIYKRNSRKRIVHAETHSEMIKIMLKYNELKLAGKFKNYIVIDNYLQQSVYYSNHFSIDVPKTKKIKYNSDLSWALLIELSMAKTKEIINLSLRFDKCLTNEYKCFHPIKYIYGAIGERLFVAKIRLKYKLKDMLKKINKRAIKEIDKIDKMDKMDKIDTNAMKFKISEDSILYN